MAVSVDESSTPDNLNKEFTSCTNSSPMFSPSSDKQFWSALRSRIDTLLVYRKPSDPSFPTKLNSGGSDCAKRMKEDSLLLLRGFDSVAHSLSQLSSNLENALQGARDLARPPTLTEIYHSAMENAKNKQGKPEAAAKGEEDLLEESDEDKRGFKRKFEEQGVDDDDSLQKVNEKIPQEKGKQLNKAKNLAISMATKATLLARELKSIKPELCFVQERCAILEEENRRLRDGFSKGIRPEEDDLVRLQLEALLFEKSRLANENANLTRENQCLHQLVEYHQLLTSSQDLILSPPASSYEHAVKGLCLDFSSPPMAIMEEEEGEGEDGNEVPRTPGRDIFRLCTSLDHECCDEEQQSAA